MPYGTPQWHKSERKLAEEGPPFAFTAENRARLEEIARRYPPERRKSALLPALYLVQEQQGYITGNAMRARGRGHRLHDRPRSRTSSRTT